MPDDQLGLKSENCPLTSPLVSIVIVNWNGKALLAECLDSLQGQTCQDFEIILVDNGSQDGSSDYVREQYPGVRLIPLKENRGFAGGNNAGITVAAGKYIALLNNDTKTDPAWIAQLVAAAETTPSAGMWASKILSYDNPGTIDNTGLMIYRDGLARGRGRLETDNGQYDVPGEVLLPSGCAALYRKTVLDEVGLFDEDFFAYADDVDLGLRIRLAGWGCLYVPTAKVYHKYSSSSSAYSPLKAFLVERNRIWVLLKYYPAELIAVSPYFTFKRLLVHAYGALTGQGASGKFAAQYSVLKAFTILVRAWCSALMAVRRIARARRELSRFRRIGRSELYRLFREFGLSATEIALKE
jgi:GT2 family glycosyltransferase